MQRRWRAWLRGKYGTIEALRAAWGRPDLAAFESVPVPKDPLRGPAPEVAARLCWQAAKEILRKEKRCGTCSGILWLSP
jgi:hypothetical protein